MGAPTKDIKAADEASAEALLTSLRTIDPAERRRHASVFNYWLSIRGTRHFPAIRDLDPLEISDAGPFSVLMEMIGGGEDAEIRHIGHAIRAGVEANRISEVPSPSLLSCIHAKLPIVAASRQAFAFEDSFETDQGPQRCWVSLLPLSANGTWIDFVYAFVSLDGASGVASEMAKADRAEAPDASMQAPNPFEVELRPYDETDALETAPEPTPVVVEPEADAVAPVVEEIVEMPEPEPDPVTEMGPEPEPVAALDPGPNPEPEFESKLEPEPVPPAKAGFSSKMFESLANVGGFYGKVAKAIPAIAPAPATADDVTESADVDDVTESADMADMADMADVADEPSSILEQAAAQPAAAVEGPLHDKLSNVRAMAEEARQAQERSNVALFEGLSAAYDFALDAEDEPDEYLRLVETQGLKIQLRSPMKPVVKLAFAGLCDDDTIGKLEAVLAWALKVDLPRGSLAERIQAEGGIGRILAGTAS